MADEKSPRTEFVVLFKTFCGCHKTEVMTAPLPSEQLIPVPPSLMRRFALRNVSEENGVAEYVEQL